MVAFNMIALHSAVSAAFYSTEAPLAPPVLEKIEICMGIPLYPGETCAEHCDYEWCRDGSENPEWTCVPNDARNGCVNRNEKAAAAEKAEEPILCMGIPLLSGQTCAEHCDIDWCIDSYEHLDWTCVPNAARDGCVNRNETPTGFPLGKWVNNDAKNKSVSGTVEIKDDKITFNDFKHSDGRKLALYVLDRKPEDGPEHSPAAYTQLLGASELPREIQNNDNPINFDISVDSLSSLRNSPPESLWFVVWCQELNVWFGALEFTNGWEKRAFEAAAKEEAAAEKAAEEAAAKEEAAAAKEAAEEATAEKAAEEAAAKKAAEEAAEAAKKAAEEAAEAAKKAAEEAAEAAKKAAEEARCTKKDCNNRGKCKGTVLRPKCICNRGYKGAKCQKKTRCTKKDCNNHGKCKGTVLSPKCTCNRGYEGDKCENVQSDCLKRDVDYYGDDIPGREHGAIKSSHDECAKTCQGISACKFWTWNASNGRCWPKHGQGKRRDVKNVISGSKFCGNPVIRCTYNGNECDRRNSRCVKRTDLHSGCTSGYLSQCVCSAPGTGINCWFGNAAKRCGEAKYCVRNDNENRVCKSGKQSCHCKKRIATSNPISGAYVEVLRGHDVSCDSRGCFDSNKDHKTREAAEERCNVLAECAMIMYWPPSRKFVLRRIDDPVKSTGHKTVVYAKVGGTYTATIKGRSIKCSGRCLNGNKAYAVKEVAVGKCLITPGCDSVMRSGNGKFYLRALSASSRPNSRFEVFTTPKRRKTCPKSRPNGKSCTKNCDCETLCVYVGNKNSGKKCHC